MLAEGVCIKMVRLAHHFTPVPNRPSRLTWTLSNKNQSSLRPEFTLCVPRIGKWNFDSYAALFTFLIVWSSLIVDGCGGYLSTQCQALRRNGRLPDLRWTWSPSEAFFSMIGRKRRLLEGLWDDTEKLTRMTISKRILHRERSLKHCCNQNKSSSNKNE